MQETPPPVAIPRTGSSTSGAPRNAGTNLECKRGSMKSTRKLVYAGKIPAKDWESYVGRYDRLFVLLDQ